MTARLATIASCFAAMVIALLLGCAGSSHSSSSAAANERAFLVVSGDTAGWIVPCGCVSNQSGGILRRGEYLRNLADLGPVVYLDVGGAASGASAYDREKFEAILRSEITMDVKAHNLGAAEVALGLDYLRRIAAQLEAPFVSCNVRDAAGKMAADPVRFVDSAGRRLAIVGVLSESTQGEDFVVDPPTAAVLNAVREIKQPYDSLVVLAYLAETELFELAKALPEADLVVGGPTTQSIAPRTQGPTLVASATNKGKFLVEAEFEKGGSRWRGRIVELNDEYADEPRQEKVLQGFYQRLAERDFTPQDTSFRRSYARSEIAVAGVEQCRDCHEADCNSWDSTSHASAWTSLTNTGAQVDPYCQQCHTTGYGTKGGFVSVGRSISQRGVGCESCHGPSAAHCRDPSLATASAAGADQSCLRCHDKENSPQFQYASYWPRVAHGAAKRPSVGKP